MDLIILFVPIFLLFLLKPIANKFKHHYLQAGRPPPGPRNFPFLGSIHHLLRRQPLHCTLRDLSIVHGPIMRLQLGELRIVIISSPEAARAIMKTHDLAFASRPLTTSIKILCYGGKDLIFSPYNNYWRQMRRLCTLELLSPKRILSFRSIREEEISQLIRSIAKSSTVTVDIRNSLAKLSNNITTRAVIGGRSDDQHIFLLALQDVIKLTLTFSVADLFPSMPKFLGILAGFRLKRSWLKMDKILEKIVQDHSKKKAKVQGEIEDDLTDILLRVQQDVSILGFPLSNDHIKAVINDMLMAGSETTTTTMEWVMSELVRNPSAMDKAQREVRKVLKGSLSNVIVEEELVSGKLSYLSLVIKETLRLHPPVPLLLPRENQEHIEVMGYKIPAKTMVMVNIWAIGRDPKLWDDPDTFRPERFKDNLIDLNGSHFEFIPFGAGRRICPGIHFGLMTVETTLAYLLYYFDWRYTSKKGEELDMTEKFGPALRRKSPLCLIATPHFQHVDMYS